MKKPKQIRLSKFLQKWGTAELTRKITKEGEADITPKEVKAGDLLSLPDGDASHPTFNAWEDGCLYRVLPDLAA